MPHFKTILLLFTSLQSIDHLRAVIGEVHLIWINFKKSAVTKDEDLFYVQNFTVSVSFCVAPNLFS